MFEGSFTAKLRVKRDFKRCTGWLGNKSIQNINQHGENACRQNYRQLCWESYKNRIGYLLLYLIIISILLY